VIALWLPSFRRWAA